MKNNDYYEKLKKILEDGIPEVERMRSLEEVFRCDKCPHLKESHTLQRFRNDYGGGTYGYMEAMDCAYCTCVRSIGTDIDDDNARPAPSGPPRGTSPIKRRIKPRYKYRGPSPSIYIYDETIEDIPKSN